MYTINSYFTYTHDIVYTYVLLMYTKRYTCAIGKEITELKQCNSLLHGLKLEKYYWYTKATNKYPNTLHYFICIVQSCGRSRTTVTHYPNSFHIPIIPFTASLLLPIQMLILLSVCATLHYHTSQYTHQHRGHTGSITIFRMRWDPKW